MRLLRFLMWCGVLLLLSAPALAQTAKKPTWASQLGARAFGTFERQQVAATDTFDALFGKTTLQGVGGGVEVDHLWRRVFARVAFTRMSVSGERVFVFNGTVFPLGVALDVTMTPVELAAGWRFAPKGKWRIVPYVGGGALFMKYLEETEFEESTENVRENYKGFVVFGGLEVPVWRFVTAGAEAALRRAKVPDPGGALAEFREDDLGGFTMRVMISIRR